MKPSHGQRYATLTPYIIVGDGLSAIAFYSKAFGATVENRLEGPKAQTMYAELRFGDTMVILSDPHPGNGPPPPNEAHGGLYIYVDDVDDTVRRCVAEGATVTQTPCDTYWGERNAMIVDPFGHQWVLAQRLREIGPAEFTTETAKFVEAESTPR